MKESIQLFGGNWTDEKLQILKNYLQAYITALKKQSFELMYIDAFAGTGYRKKRKNDKLSHIPLLPEFAEQESKLFLDGSATIALKIVPPFDRYIFIELDKERYVELNKLKNEFPILEKNIIIKNEEANACLIELCKRIDWRRYRAVLFLDPYGMEVQWKTIEAIAKTKSIDLWYLFPLGVGVNRLLRKDGKINEAEKKRLDLIFGTDNWYDIFYKTYQEKRLFDEIKYSKKVVDFNQIAEFFVGRLKTIFAGVAQNPRPLYNSKNNPLYLLCFAASNPKGSRIAINIAQHILKGWPK